jgi:uncharacterized small protein (DUF1192 family)
MKLQELRDWLKTASSGDWFTMPAPSMLELVDDIDAQLKLATHGFAGYRDGCKVGWNGALNTLRKHMMQGPRVMWTRDDLKYKLDELLSNVNDVPEPDANSPDQRRMREKMMHDILADQIRNRREHMNAQQAELGDDIAPKGVTEILLNLEERMLEQEKRNVALDREFDGRRDMLSQRIDALEAKLETDTASRATVEGLFKRIETLEKIKLDETFKTYSNFERRLNSLFDIGGDHNDRMLQLEAAMRRYNEQVGTFENRLDDALSKALKRVEERLEYLERQEKMTLGVFEEQREMIVRIDRRCDKLNDRLEEVENWRANVRA